MECLQKSVPFCWLTAKISFLASDGKTSGSRRLYTQSCTANGLVIFLYWCGGAPQAARTGRKSRKPLASRMHFMEHGNAPKQSIHLLFSARTPITAATDHPTFLIITPLARGLQRSLIVSLIGSSSLRPPLFLSVPFSMSFEHSFAKCLRAVSDLKALSATGF